MGTKKYYWLKLKNDFFKNKKIKKLRRIAGGDTYTIIYLKMQLLSITTAGKLYFENVEDSFADELALELDEDVDNVKVTLMFLIKNGLLVEINEEEYLLPEALECVGSETSKAELMRKKRAKEKISGNNVTDLLPEVTKSYTEIEIEKELDKEINKDKDIRDKIPYEKIKDLFHEICVSFPKVMKLNENRKKTIKARYNEYNSEIEIFRTLFTKAEESNFLKGNNDNNWNATFDWLLKPQNMIKVLEGNYENKHSTFTKTRKPVREEIVPDWFNKQIKKEEMPPEELAELQEQLNSFNEGVPRQSFEERKKALEARLKEKYRKKKNL